MICPACGTLNSSVDKTMGMGSSVVRVRGCRCGATWSTEEKVLRNSLQVRIGVPRRRILPELKARVMERDGGRCRYCGTTQKLGIDHVVPLAAPVPAGVAFFDEADRRNGFDNLAACCLPCNLRKGDSMKLPVAASNQMPPPLTTSHNPQLHLAAGGVGGGLSGVPNSVQDSGSVPSLTPVLEASGGSGARARKSAAVVYSPHFETFWDNIGSTRSKGSKAEAQEQWEKKGRPAADKLIAKWNEYLVSVGDLSPRDVCRWLRLDMHVQEYNTPIRAIAARPVTGFEKAQLGHQQMFDAGQAWARGEK